MITELVGLVFLLLCVYVCYRFLTYGKNFNHVTEPDLNTVALDRQAISEITIDVPNAIVIGRGGELPS